MVIDIMAILTILIATFTIVVIIIEGTNDTLKQGQSTPI